MQNAREIRRLYGDDEYSQPASVMECTGVESSVCTAAFSVRRGGTLMVIGVGRPVMNNIPFMHLSLAEIDLKFINRYRDTWPAAIQCLSGEVLNLNKLVTHKFPLEKAVEAFELNADPTTPSIKIHIVDDVDVVLNTNRCLLAIPLPKIVTCEFNSRLPAWVIAWNAASHRQDSALRAIGRPSTRAGDRKEGEEARIGAPQQRHGGTQHISEYWGPAYQREAFQFNLLSVTPRLAISSLAHPDGHSLVEDEGSDIPTPAYDPPSKAPMLDLTLGLFLPVNLDRRPSICVPSTDATAVPLHAYTQMHTKICAGQGRVLVENLRRDREIISPFSDGSPQVSQWPIAPGEYFDYEIHPEIGDAGTYFYHSHVGFQAMTAHGALYVEDAGTPPYKYDEDVPVVLSDFYQKSDEEIESELTGTPFQWPGEPDSLVFNDRSGTASFDDAPDDSCKPYIITVEPSKTYRFRFIGGATISFIQLGIEGHTNLTVISVDGYYTKPAKVDHIQLGGGQRFDTLITMKSQEELSAEGKDQYWIRYETRGRSPGLAGYALLQYDSNKSSSSTTKHKKDIGASRSLKKAGRSTPKQVNNARWYPKPPGKLPSQPPISLPPDGTLTNWLEYTLEELNPRTPFPKLSEVTRTLYITVSEEVVNGTYVGGSVTGSLVWVNNDLTWTADEAASLHYQPYLIDAYLNGRTPDYKAAASHKGWDPAMRAFPAHVGEVLDIVWLSNSGPSGIFEYHPMHAHGDHYWDLGAGDGTYDAVANEKHFATYTPARRDTTMLYRYATKGKNQVTSGWRAWRIRITDDNVGAWLMHCHILHHMIMGMQTAWVFGDAASILRNIPEPYIAGYLNYGGSAYGNDSYDPLVLTYFDE
ncbi:hypothetical protein NUW58_g3103 [Xylaria curta]|uniref:Uncharacterized protein n=1 Tax=Xylaria curta TaxID=42375 RepID=A0ACC1PFL7_9PEZI|nr:hypothetical protein NUW58_g3103 [Xylaria curta]